MHTVRPMNCRSTAPLTRGVWNNCTHPRVRVRCGETTNYCLAQSIQTNTESYSVNHNHLPLDTQSEILHSVSGSDCMLRISVLGSKSNLSHIRRDNKIARSIRNERPILHGIFGERERNHVRDVRYPLPPAWWRLHCCWDHSSRRKNSVCRRIRPKPTWVLLERLARDSQTVAYFKRAEKWMDLALRYFGVR